MVCVMPSGFSTRRDRNDQNGSPLAFSTMSPAMLKLVLSVLVLRARLEIERLGRPAFVDRLVRRRRPGPRRNRVVLRGVVLCSRDVWDRMLRRSTSPARVSLGKHYRRPDRRDAQLVPLPGSSSTHAAVNCRPIEPIAQRRLVVAPIGGSSRALPHAAFVNTTCPPWATPTDALGTPVFVENAHARPRVHLRPPVGAAAIPAPASGPRRPPSAATRRRRSGLPVFMCVLLRPVSLAGTPASRFSTAPPPASVSISALRRLTNVAGSSSCPPSASVA